MDVHPGGRLRRIRPRDRHRDRHSRTGRADGSFREGTQHVLHRQAAARIDNRVWAKCRRHYRDVHLQRQGRRRLYFGRTDFHRRRHVHRLLQSGSSKPQNGCRYVHRNHRPAADQPSLRRKNLQVLRRHRKRHAYREQADILQHGGQSFRHYTSRYGAHLL